RRREAMDGGVRACDAEPYGRDGPRRVVGVSVAGPADSLREGLRALERAYTLGHHGPAVARRRAALVDACLVELFEHAGAPARVALVATGGYGRMVQLPASDIDLLVVHDDPASI